MFYSEIYDIDWFFLDKNNFVGLIASGGGKIPPEVKNDTEYNLREYFNSFPDINKDVTIDEDAKVILGTSNQQKMEKIFSDFIFMARKGIYCFDKTVLNNAADTNYHKIAEPTDTILTLDDLPTHIGFKLNKLKFNIDIRKENKLDIQRLLF